MTDAKVLEVLKVYRQSFEARGVAKRRSPPEAQAAAQIDRLAHLHWMLDEIESFLAAGRREKAMRWLGFIQGCLWADGLYTVAEMKDQNRPDQGTE
jgi:hypothetical protein